MGEFIVALMFTLPGYFLVCGFMGADVAERNTPLVVIVSILAWAVLCLSVYGIAYAIANALL
ncbi:hypothetical protein Pan44_29800 [Caulifigura coniformis]|uniref:Uncharacterized protein n=1 Tax=Caulifigura coniformis TaxID=2527983 RepID=A0A517SFN7_9PLAN|nr:hypothetical protein [Caulifigura coniformis]QDT54939.1 hypothetical protein Pan44_29800 [Caulifigura coniformis]